MLYFLIFFLVAMAAAVLLFRIVAHAAAEITRAFLLTSLVFFPVSVFSHFARRKIKIS